MRNRKAQSILEYLIVLTTILAAIVFIGQGKYDSALQKGYEDGGNILTYSTKAIRESVN